MAVHTTLYGILKSGVGRYSSKLVVLIYLPPLSSKILITAGATSKPLFASGGYSVYRRIAFSNSYVIVSVDFAGTERTTSMCEARTRSTAGR